MAKDRKKTKKRTNRKIANRKRTNRKRINRKRTNRKRINRKRTNRKRTNHRRKQYSRKKINKIVVGGSPGLSLVKKAKEILRALQQAVKQGKLPNLSPLRQILKSDEIRLFLSRKLENRLQKMIAHLKEKIKKYSGLLHTSKDFKDTFSELFSKFYDNLLRKLAAQKITTTHSVSDYLGVIMQHSQSILSGGGRDLDEKLISFDAAGIVPEPDESDDLELGEDTDGSSELSAQDMATRNKIDKMYAEHNPQKLPEVDALIKKYGLNNLLEQMQRKYASPTLTDPDLESELTSTQKWQRKMDRIRRENGEHIQDLMGYSAVGSSEEEQTGLIDVIWRRGWDNTISEEGGIIVIKKGINYQLNQRDDEFGEYDNPLLMTEHYSDNSMWDNGKLEELPSEEKTIRNREIDTPGIYAEVLSETVKWEEVVAKAGDRVEICMPNRLLLNGKFGVVIVPVKDGRDELIVELEEDEEVTKAIEDGTMKQKILLKRAWLKVINTEYKESGLDSRNVQEFQASTPSGVIYKITREDLMNGCVSAAGLKENELVTKVWDEKAKQTKKKIDDLNQNVRSSFVVPDQDQVSGFVTIGTILVFVAIMIIFSMMCGWTTGVLGGKAVVSAAIIAIFGEQVYTKMILKEMVILSRDMWTNGKYGNPHHDKNHVKVTKTLFTIPIYYDPITWLGLSRACNIPVQTLNYTKSTEVARILAAEEKGGPL